MTTVPAVIENVPVAPDYPPTVADGLDPVPAALGWQPGPPRPVTLPSGERAWLVSQFDQVRTVLADPRFSRALAAEDGGRRFARVAPPAGSLLALDPPDHTRLRGLVAGAFTRRRVEDLADDITVIADGLIDRLLSDSDGRTPVELISAFCLPLPVAVICRLLGVPVEDAAQFEQWSSAFLSSSGADRAEIGRAAGQLAAYLGGLAGRRKADPQPDLISALVEAADDGERLSPQETVSLCIAILVAGYETTSAELANGLWLLLSEPARADYLRADPGRIPAAVEELLRWVSLGVGGGFPRVLTEDVELGGVRLRAGEAVIPAIDAANRDPNVFAEPDAIQLDRDPRSTMAFGHGLHFCLGAQLARLELRIALERLLRRLPALRLAGESIDPQWRQGNLVRCLTRLEVLWS